MSEFELEDAFFGSGASPAEVYVEPEPSEEEWEAWSSELDEGPEEQEPVDPLEYPQLQYPQGDQPGAFEQDLGAEMRRQSWGEQFHEDVAAAVRGMGADREFEITSEQAVERVTSGVLAAREYVFRSWLGNGASVSQAIEALQDLDLESAIRQGLEGERYQVVTSGDRSLADWRQGRRDAAVKRAREGLEPVPDVYDSPTIQRMWAASNARVARELQRREQMQAVVDRVVHKQWWR